MHYPPETTTIYLILKLVANYKQSEDKEAFLNAVQDFQHELIGNENGMMTHKMLGANHQNKLNDLFALFANSIDFTGMEIFKNIDIFKRLFTLIGNNSFEFH